MKKILKIARLELSILFYSPIAWLILIIFIIQSGVTFTSMLNVLESKQQLGANFEFLTAEIFAGLNGFFAAVQKKLYLYIPLLTMGLMSREISSGSIKLLLSSPLTNLQIILGKFVAMMAYGALLMLVLLGVTISGFFAIENLDVTHVLGGILGLYLLICAYAAIGVFMSSLTSYQVVAAISTLAVLAALNFVGSVGQTYDFVRDITYWVSISGRANNFINGMIGSNDVIYFLLVIVAFLTLSIMRLNAGRELRSQTSTIARYTLVVVAVLFVGYLTSMPWLIAYYDTTRLKTNTLTDKSLAIIKKLDHPVSITTYPNVLSAFANIGAPKMRNFELRAFEKYRRFLPGIKFNYVSYYDTTIYSRDKTKSLEERAIRAATAHGYDFSKLLSPVEIKKVIDLGPEENIFVRTINYNGKHTFLRMYFDMIGYPEEAEISAALKRLLFKPPVVGILNQNEERSLDKTGDKAYKNILNSMNTRKSLINQGFDLKRIDLSASGEIPADLAVLIIADPKVPYSTAQLQKIALYIQNGGNALVAAEPGRQSELNVLLKPFGVQLMQGALLQESPDLDVNLIHLKPNKISGPLDIKIDDQYFITMPGTVGITYKKVAGYNYLPLLTTDQKYVWNKLGTFDDSGVKIPFNPLKDTRVNVPVALAVTRKLQQKDQKIIVIGDADFMSNAEGSRYKPQSANVDFAVNLFKWFSNGEFPIDITRPKSTDNHILMSHKQISWLKILCLGILPLVLASSAAYILISRKRK
ncbi:Gldg family protein [Pedobacter sp. MC2016-14]|uniref:Gldg family protein n=1 Tax=Pedobacter sp. MC2016-14 TaxID=2897327 RepID=UPI001E559CFD|nr:Gldg family protein [Pedobacter sp. MC2016-14]MCD0486982.1 Gldg family protein [Pedobacter sp. MC2016-14]